MAEGLTVVNGCVDINVGTAVNVTGGALGKGVFDGVNVIIGGSVGGSAAPERFEGARTKANSPIQ